MKDKILLCVCNGGNICFRHWTNNSTIKFQFFASMKINSDRITAISNAREMYAFWYCFLYVLCVYILFSFRSQTSLLPFNLNSEAELYNSQSNKRARALADLFRLFAFLTLFSRLHSASSIREFYIIFYCRIFLSFIFFLTWTMSHRIRADILRCRSFSL